MLGQARATNDSYAEKIQEQDALILQLNQTIADRLQLKADAAAVAALATAAAQLQVPPTPAGPDAAQIPATKLNISMDLRKLSEAILRS